MRNLTILISMLQSRIDNLDNLLSSIPSWCYIIIIIQKDCLLDQKQQSIINKLELDQRIILKFSDTSGVTISRNIALDLVETKYAIFCDDDITYLPEALDNVVLYFSKYPDAAFLTFNVQDENNHNLKNYPNNIIKHNLFTILKVGTIEIAINTTKSETIRFPEDMGAGQDLFCCDEPVYLSNLLKSNEVGYHIPITICQHPIVSSGKSLNKKYSLKSRYECFSRIFGQLLGTSLFILFCLKNIKKFFKH